MLLCDQNQSSKRLTEETVTMIGAVGNLPKAHRGTIDETPHKFSGLGYFITLAAVSALLETSICFPEIVSPK